MMITKAGRWRALLVLMAPLLALDTAAAERVALVMGNGRYQNVPLLNNPLRDASAVAQTLQTLGFTVTGPLRDQSKAQMEAALGDFGRRAQTAAAAVVYFAGHGIEVDGDNYLVPIDAVLRRDRDAALEAVKLEVVLDQVGSARDYGLVILDACRDNPFARQMQRQKGTRTVHRGLAPVEPGGQTYIAYAARAGSQAQEGTSEHSPFTTALLTYLRNYRREPLPLPSLFGAVREDVLATTSGEQEPWLYGAFGRKPIYLIDQPSPVTTGTLVIRNSQPPGVVIYVDGARLGAAPQRLEGLSVGKAVTVTARQSGYDDYQERVWIRGGQASELNAVLTALSRGLVPLPAGEEQPRQTANNHGGNPHVESLLSSADRFVASNQLSKASDALERAVRIEPRNAGIWHDLAQIRFHQNQYEQTESLARKSNDLASENPKLLSRNWALIAAVCKARGDAAGAEQARAYASSVLKPR